MAVRSLINTSLKIDYDKHSFLVWLSEFGKRYSRLHDVGIVIDGGKVFRTRHGYHIYLDMHEKCSYNTRLLVECFLMSDVLKQLYAYVEGNDILFVNKNNGASVSVFNLRLTTMLRRRIAMINGRRRRRASYLG